MLDMKPTDIEAQPIVPTVLVPVELKDLRLVFELFIDVSKRSKEISTF